ncbi:MAG: hypothetical protein GSR84_01750 [Desulfurococcales archaeon]|nr:hypothetical protein [Desulfurococcales archaeon]
MTWRPKAVRSQRCCVTTPSSNSVDAVLWELEGDLAHVLPERKTARQRTGGAVQVNA